MLAAFHTARLLTHAANGRIHDVTFRTHARKLFSCLLLVVRGDILTNPTLPTRGGATPIIVIVTCITSEMEWGWVGVKSKYC